jgi:hypothetical protein
MSPNQGDSLFIKFIVSVFIKKYVKPLPISLLRPPNAAFRHLATAMISLPVFSRNPQDLACPPFCNFAGPMGKSRRKKHLQPIRIEPAHLAASKRGNRGLALFAKGIRDDPGRKPFHFPRPVPLQTMPPWIKSLDPIKKKYQCQRFPASSLSTLPA